MNRRVHIQTMGCQMNVHDSARMEDLLAPMGYEPWDSPRGADLIIVNTCAVREKAEDKVYSYLGRLAEIKARRPDLLIAVAGCVAQARGAEILTRAPAVDMVIGTHAMARVAQVVAERVDTGRPVVDTALGDTLPLAPLPRKRERISAFVTIMSGCDNFCSYCVVPHVRGREISRPPEEILAEVRALADQGVKELTLLGQNVNSYGKKEGMPDFVELLDQVHGVSGIQRLRFVTSHPKDLSPALVDAFSRLDKLCGRVHLPVQSGSDRVLAAMNRRYTVGQYLEKLSALRRVREGMAVTTDIIVGFPGETRAEFQQTLDLVAEGDFDGVFSFKYSDRPYTAASGFPDKISEAEKSRRLNELIELANEIGLRKNRALEGTVCTVLVEGASRKDEREASGRCPDNRTVNFPAENARQLVGTFVEVRIERGNAHSLWGRPAAGPDRTRAQEVTHAA
ncbi:MAG: tRNA (N6-isopentenyl adenosine(37)-C2)-methylthiotransferase MiaB [Pseudomonadota bacterium]